MVVEATESKQRLIEERDLVATQSRADIEVLRFQMREALAQTHAERDLLKIQLRRNETKWNALSAQQRDSFEQRVSQVRNDQERTMAELEQTASMATQRADGLQLSQLKTEELLSEERKALCQAQAQVGVECGGYLRRIYSMQPTFAMLRIYNATNMCNAAYKHDAPNMCNAA